MFEEASSFMLWHTWCENLEGIQFVGGFAHVAVFFVVAATAKGRIEYWVVVGDVPPLYLDTAGGTIDTAAKALDAYTYVMEIWVEAALGVKNDEEEEIPPVLTRKDLRPVRPTREYADMLSRRLRFTRHKVVPSME